MLDLALLRDDPDGLASAMARRHVEVDLAALADLDTERRATRARAEQLRAEQKASGKRIATLSGDDKQVAIGEASRLSSEYRRLVELADDLDAVFNETWLTLPNPPHESVPDGDGDHDNLEIKKWGEIPVFDFDERDHVDIGEALDIIDIERGAKVSGARFAYLKGTAVLLEFALIRWALDRLVAEGFVPVIPPVLVREEALFGTGFFPGNREQVYAVGSQAEADGEVIGDGLYLAATAEIPLAGLHSDEILDGADLPIRYGGFSTCFRREAGTYGKDTRGIFRVHQFDKLEMFSYCHPETAWDEHEYLLSVEEGIVQGLELPYRVVNVCIGDLGDPAAKKYDIEAWFPGQGAYREVTSCSNTTDFQSRRLRIRFRNAGAIRPVHTLNGTAIAVGRTLVALLENHQQADGSVLVPNALQPYLGMERVGP